MSKRPIPMQKKPTATRKKFPPIVKVATPERLQALQAFGQLERDFTVYEMGNISIFLGHDSQGFWHMSMAHPKRYPMWDEIVHVRYALIPDDVTMAMILPPMDQYINVHDNCFQLHQIGDGNG